MDADVAAYYLACSLGIMGPEDGSLDKFRDAKHVFWSANPLGEALVRFLDNLVECDVLEFQSDGVHYRWNGSFIGTWENKIR